jgi:hypothetical protein
MSFSPLAVQVIVKNAYEKIEYNPLSFFNDPLIECYCEEQRIKEQQLENKIKDVLESLEIEDD